MTLDVYIDGWVIGDGNYDHFREGETRQFALEFYAPFPLRKVASSSKRFEASSGYMYDVGAEVVFASEDICVVDFGLLAFSDSSADIKAGYQVGDFVEGSITLDVDPFFYFERLSKIAAVPPLIYEWRINSIEQETTPLVLSEACGRPVYVRDESRRSYQFVGATDENITAPPEVSPSYVLHCTKLDTSPAKTFRRNG